MVDMLEVKRSISLDNPDDVDWLYAWAKRAEDELRHLRSSLESSRAELAEAKKENTTLRERVEKAGGLPKVVCLCGSTRFKDAFDEANYQETMAGRIVLSVGFFMHASGNKHGEGVGATPEQKVALDELHKRKIDLADEVFVLNVGGYVGDSTRSEIDYATAHNKPIRYLESTPKEHP